MGKRKMYLYRLWSHTKFLVNTSIFIFFCLFKGPCASAQELKPSFTLDTAKTQVFPFDLEFKLKLIGRDKKPIKAAYLYRLDKNGYVVIEKNTSLTKFGWTSYYDENEINKSIKIGLIRAQNYLDENQNSLSSWENKYNELKDKEIVLMALDEGTASEELSCLRKEIFYIEYKINEYERSRKLVEKEFINRKRLIKEYKKRPAILPLSVLSRINDTIIVKVTPLRPNKKYLIVALDYSNKIEVLGELVKEFNECGTFEKRYASLIPRDYSTTELWDSVAQVVSPELLKKGIKKIDSLLKKIKEQPKLTEFESSINFPGPFKYPVNIIENRLFSDSLYLLPEGSSGDFRGLNAVLVASKNYGDNIVTGTNKIEVDADNRIKMNFEPQKGLTNQRSTITHNLQLVTKAKQTLLLLAETNIDSLESFTNYLDNLIGVLNKNRQLLDKKIDTNNTVNDLLSKELIPLGQNLSTFEKTTSSYQFLTRNSRLIKPDFGLIYYYSGDGFSGVAPFTGFHFGIRGTNEDIPFGQIRGWEKLLTFQVGVPFFTGDLTKGERRKHLVGDTFSLYGGVGLNLNHTIRFSYGALLFRGIDGNSFGERNFKIKAAHAFSFSINLKLKSLFEGLYGSIQSLKAK